MIFGAAGHMGLAGLVVRDIVKYPEERAATLGTTATLKFIGLGAGYGVLVAYAAAYEGVGTVAFQLVVLAGAALLLRPAEVIEFWFQAFVQARYISVARLASHIVSAGVRLLLVASGASLVLFALAPVAQGIMVAVILVYFFRGKSSLRLSDLRFDWGRARSLLSQGWIVYLGSLFAVVYLKVDQVMLRWLAGTDEVGQYAVAAQFSEALYFLPVAIVASVFPKLIELRQRSESEFYARLQQLLDLLFIMGVGVAVLLTVSAGWIIATLFGDPYAASAGILIIHVWSAIFVFMRAAVSKWILIENALYFSLLTQGLGAFVNVGLNFLWIPDHGGIGAAYATLCSYAVASFLALAFSRKSRRLFWMMALAFASVVRYPRRLIRSSWSR
jgi:O-antigen/teichoic acid export membrane protein